MSRHDGVSCDVCMKRNMSGLRYKCLNCANYDLCAACYESGKANGGHSTEHFMQCLLTKDDAELFYSSESLQTDCHSFTCPYCGRMGLTEVMMASHVGARHVGESRPVVCPLCACLSDAVNLMVPDLAGHLALEHGNPVREIISLLDEPNRGAVAVQRLPRAGPRARHGLAHVRLPPAAARAFASVSSSFESADSISELIGQMSVGRVERPERVLAVGTAFPDRTPIRRTRRVTMPAPPPLQPEEPPPPPEPTYTLLRGLLAEPEPVSSDQPYKTEFVRDLITSSLTKPYVLPTPKPQPPYKAAFIKKFLERNPSLTDFNRESVFGKKKNS